MTVKPIRNLNGHSIGPYRIHAGNTVPGVDVHCSSTESDIGATLHHAGWEGKAEHGKIKTGGNKEHVQTAREAVNMQWCIVP